jgi:hypothetical protein
VDRKEHTNQIRGHVLTAVGILAACGWIIYESLRMSRDSLEKGVAELYTVPGLLPLVIGTLVVGLSLFVILYYLRRISLGDFEWARVLKTMYVPVLVFSMLFLYIFILIPNVPFVLATIIFTSLFMAVFNASSVLKISISSLVYSVLVVYFFIKVVGTRFPVTLLNF